MIHNRRFPQSPLQYPKAGLLHYIDRITVFAKFRKHNTVKSFTKISHSFDKKNK